MVRKGINMRISPPFFCVLLLVGGVSGVEKKKVTLSVMKGDTVTLMPDDAEIQTDDQILWKFDGSIITNMKKDGRISTYDGADGRFKEKLLPDNQNGSLTITSLTADHTGIYQLEIKSRTEIYKKYSVTVHDVVESLSVMEGDSVTLHTGVTKIQGDDQILWEFGDQGTLIARLNGTVGGSWRNIHLKDQTGELTISNIRSDQIGAYKMEFNNSSMILHRKFNISGDGMKTESVKKGDPVTLDTSLIEIKGYDLILWMSEGHVMAEMNRTTNTFLLFSAEGKFKGRLQRNQQTGSLIIRDSRSTDSGVYHLHMSSSTYTLQRTISVTVTDVPVTDVPVTGQDLTTQKTLIGIIVVLVLLVLVAVIIGFVFYWKKHQRQNHATAGEGNGLAKESDETEVL